MSVREITNEEYEKLLKDSKTLANLKDSLYIILEDENTDLLDVALKTLEILKMYD